LRFRNDLQGDGTVKDGIHPKYQDVVIKDISSGFQMITRSTKSVKERITVDGVEYPLIMVEVSSASHPYYTGKQILVDSAGRIDRFKRRYTEVVGAKRHTRDAAPVQAAPKTLSKTKLKKLAKEKSGASAPAAESAPAASVESEAPAAE
jgi:large subunit ribosomal protein L31